MGSYVAQWDYISSYGSFTAGAVLDLDEETADAIERDSPGVLKAKKKAAEREVSEPPADRMLKRARTRGQGGGEGPITKEDHKAVKE